MAASIIIERESGTYTRPIHRHNGYYAGDFFAPKAVERTAADSRSILPAPPHVGPAMHEARPGTRG